MGRITTFVTVHVTEAAREALRQAVIDLTSPVGRKVTHSDLVLGALDVARKHPEELCARLRGENEATEDETTDGGE